MKLKRDAVVAVLLAVFVLTARADVPPDPGFVRVRLSILLESKEDLSDYRFFLVSSNLVKEIEIKNGETATVGSLGGGARYSSGTVVAVQAKSLESFGANPSGEKLTELENAIAEDRIAGSIKLLTHSFSRDVRKAEASGLKDPLYRLERTAEKTVKAVLVTGGAVESKTGNGAGTYYSSEPKTPAFWATVAGGSLFTIAFILIGVWILRRSKTRSSGLSSQQ